MDGIPCIVSDAFGCFGPTFLSPSLGPMSSCSRQNDMDLMKALEHTCVFSWAPLSEIVLGAPSLQEGSAYLTGDPLGDSLGASVRSRQVGLA